MDVKYLKAIETRDFNDKSFKRLLQQRVKAVKGFDLIKFEETTTHSVVHFQYQIKEGYTLAGVIDFKVKFPIILNYMVMDIRQISCRNQDFKGRDYYRKNVKYLEEAVILVVNTCIDNQLPEMNSNVVIPSEPPGYDDGGGRI